MLYMIQDMQSKLPHYYKLCFNSDLKFQTNFEFNIINYVKNARTLDNNEKDEWIKKIPEKIWNYCATVGNPFNAGNFNKGDSILDIGCGAGVDLCVASLLVGEQGKVIGIDITPAMVEKAKINATLAGLSNITVHQGSIDKLPVDDDTIDTVISNGAINLSSSKNDVFLEIYRVLKVVGIYIFVT